MMEATDNNFIVVSAVINGLLVKLDLIVDCGSFYKNKTTDALTIDLFNSLTSLAVCFPITTPTYFLGSCSFIHLEMTYLYPRDF